ncbi:hypothetical protein MOBT1_000349 [Malassezia obtusa]|uniref:TRIP4/RQT4 C2HC5-type zinc finger domain-containing protein n=1 Tax=Malassezia obtusa TaxID=76774 RepID=A0AAF0DW97_9BASI|nr:hypothetical protein MOBT1_000349 [Malassezia obtusa]
MPSGKLEEELGALLGLDHETVKEQVVPYLATHSTPKALRLYLQDLIGTSAAAKALTEKYVADRFPSHPAPSASSSGAENARPSAPPQRPETTPAESTRKAPAKPVRLTPNNVAAALAASETAAPRALPPTQEMLALDKAFSMLSVEPSSAEAAVYAPPTRRLCLCQGARHALAEYVPMCISCGLILCDALRPIPISPHSACPSCGASPIAPSHTRSQLLAQLVEKREQLEKEQQEKEAERKAELARNRHADTPFPTLSGTNTHAPPAASKRSRVLHLDMKTHKVTVSRTKEKAAKANKEKPEALPTPESSVQTTAEDGSALVHDPQDDGFRERYMSSCSISDRHATQSWAALLPTVFHYVPPEKRPEPLEPVCSEVYTEVPDLATLIQSKPPGSSADVQRRNKKAVVASGVARAQGRKTGKASKKR